MRLLTTKDYRLRVCFIFSIICLISLSLVTLASLFTPFSTSPTTTASASSTSVESDFEVKVNEVLALGLTNCDNTNSSVVKLSITPNSTGVFKSNCQTVEIDTNHPGYTLSVFHRNGLPPNEEITTITNPPGYNNFATGNDVYNFEEDLYYNKTAILPEGAECWGRVYPGDSLRVGQDCDDSSQQWNYCIIIDANNGACATNVVGEWLEGPAPDYEYYFEVDSYDEIVCYVQPVVPGWCTTYENGTSLIKTLTSDLAYQNPTAIDPKPTIPSTTNTIESPNTLTNNTWGFAVQANNNFDTTYIIDNQNNKFAQLPAYDTTIYQTDQFPLPQTEHTFYYGTKLTTDTMAGTYTTTVTYTAIGDIVAPAPMKFKQISSGNGGAQTCGIAIDDNTYCWGSVPNHSYSGTLKLVSNGHTFTQISVSGNTACAIDINNKAYCWGDNRNGQLGDNSTNSSLTPVPVYGDYSFKQIVTNGSLSGYNTCAITTEGEPYCWGRNRNYQLGTGNSTDSLIPVPVYGNYTFKQLVNGLYYTCGIDMDDKAYCWGYAQYGQLGYWYTNLDQSRPVPVSGDHSFKQISAGLYTTCGIDMDDKAYCWGYNNYGQLGNGSINDQNLTPIAVVGDYTFKHISVIAYHVCGITTDNKTYCWGSNSYGQLGNGLSGSDNNSSIPVLVSGNYNFKQISGGDIYGTGHTCALGMNKYVYCWGGNHSYQLGNYLNSNSSVPVLVTAQVE